MKFSLIMATKGRGEEIGRFLLSLIRQDYSNFELIVVDQNEDNRLEVILKNSNLSSSIVHLKSAPGLSRARNAGLAFATGDIIAFPDDDCWYPNGLLKRVVSVFASHPSVEGLTGRWRDGLTRLG